MDGQTNELELNQLQVHAEITPFFRFYT